MKRGSPTLSTSDSVAPAGSCPTWSRDAQRSARGSSRAPAISSSSSATSWLNGTQERPPATSATAASDSGSSPEIASIAKRPCPASLPAVTRPTQPFTARASHASTSGATDSVGKRSSTPFTYGAVASARGAHHSLTCQSKRRPGIVRTASTMSARYGNAKTTDSCPCRLRRSSTLWTGSATLMRTVHGSRTRGMNRVRKASSAA